MLHLNDLAFGIVIPAVTSLPVVIGAGCLCAIPAIETALRAFADLSDLYSNLKQERTIIGDEPEKNLLRYNLRTERVKIKKELIQHALVTFFLGVCAANLFTGAGVIGILGFAIYAKKKWQKEDEFRHPSRVTQIVGVAMFLLYILKKRSYP